MFFQLILELRSLFKEKGAEINVENTQDGDIVSNLIEALKVSDVVLKEDLGGESKYNLIYRLISRLQKFNEDSGFKIYVRFLDVEHVFNIFVTIILLIPADQSEQLINTMCEKLSNEDAFGQAKLRV